jgi:hypothetical protein
MNSILRGFSAAARGSEFQRQYNRALSLREHNRRSAVKGSGFAPHFARP